MSRFNNNTPLVEFCNWMTRLAWISFLTLLFTCLGGIILGLSPALSTSIKMITEYLNGAHKVSFKQFYREWIRNLKQSNLVALPLLISVYSLWWYFDYLVNLNSFILNMIGFSLIPLACLILHLYICVCLICSQADCDLKTTMARAIKLMVTMPYIPFLFFLSLLLCIGIYYFITILAIIFSIAPALLITTTLFNKNSVVTKE